MHTITRLNTTLALASALALTAACGRTDSAHIDSAGGVTDSAAAAATPAPTTDPGTAAPGGAVSAPNALSMIGLSNAGEIQTSQIAQEKATSAEVRDYAKTMVSDHQAMQKEADELATRANLTPQAPAQANDKQAQLDQMVQQLNSTAKGAEFDRAYMNGQVQAHQQTLAELQQLQTSVDNADVRALIEKAIPKVQAHLERAQKVQAGLK